MDILQPSPVPRRPFPPALSTGELPTDGGEPPQLSITLDYDSLVTHTGAPAANSAQPPGPTSSAARPPPAPPLARARLPEGLEGITRLHALIAEVMPASWAELDPVQAAGRVRIGIETDRGTWVQALRNAGYRVYAINPMSVARYRERHSTSGAKSDPGDAHVLAEIVRFGPRPPS